MTKKTPKPTTDHMKKLADLMDTRPEGVTVQRVQHTLQVSPTLAKAALIEIGATEVEGKWVFEPEQDDATLEEIGNFVSQPQLKKLTQAVFDGLPSEYRWAVVDRDGTCAAFSKPPHYEGGWYSLNNDVLIVGYGYNSDNWQNSLIERLDAPTIIGIDWAENMETPAKHEPVTKSDFAVALEAERQRVYDAVAIGGTVERLAELTGLHVDDVQMHLDALIVDGAIYQKPIVIAMSYGVMG